MSLDLAIQSGASPFLAPQKQVQARESSQRDSFDDVLNPQSRRKEDFAPKQRRKSADEPRAERRSRDTADSQRARSERPDRASEKRTQKNPREEMAAIDSMTTAQVAVDPQPVAISSEMPAEFIDPNAMMEAPPALREGLMPSQSLINELAPVSVPPNSMAETPVSPSAAPTSSLLSPADRIAMLKFMDSMESELGVPREQFAGAMVSVSAANPEASASETAGAVIEQLNLPAEKQGQAQQMYSSLVAEVSDEESAGHQAQQVIAPAPKTQSDQTQNPLGSNQESDDKSARPTVAVAEKSASRFGKKEVNLDRVNGRFFQREGLDSGEFRRTGLEMEDEVMVPDSWNGMIEEEVSLNEKTEAPPVYFEEPLQMELPPVQHKPSAIGNYQKASGQEPSTMAAAMLAENADNGNSEQGSFEQSTGQDTANPFAAPSNAAAPKVTNTDVKPFAMQTMMQDPRVDVADTGEFVNRARMLVKQGGGEMKMQMSPEGLGQVQLRVNVQNGQVSVEMMTETDEARQLIEKSVSELRNGLSSQQLRVDDIKVDVANNTAKNEFHNQQNEAEQQMQRDMAQGFLENFRNSNRFMHDEFMAGGRGIRTYGGTNGEGPQLNPVDSGEANEVQKERGKGRRLSLVA